MLGHGGLCRAASCSRLVKCAQIADRLRDGDWCDAPLVTGRAGILASIERTTLAQADDVAMGARNAGDLELSRDSRDGHGVTASIYVVLWRAIARCIIHTYSLTKCRHPVWHVIHTHSEPFL